MESLTLDGESCHLKDEIMPKYAKLIYNGFWFSPERIMLQSLVDESQKKVNGLVKLKIYKGNIIVVGRKSKIACILKVWQRLKKILLQPGRCGRFYKTKCFKVKDP